MKIDPILSAIIDTADAANAAPDDYINPEDGLKYCGKCHTPKEAYFADKPSLFAALTVTPPNANVLPKKSSSARQNDTSLSA